MHPRGMAMMALLALLAVAGFPKVGSATADVTLEATFTSNISNGWVRVERYRDLNAGFINTGFPSDGRLDQTGQRATFFGSARPHSSRFLLYYGPGWATGTKPVPVLLVHGAYGDADWVWANPASGAMGCGAATCPGTGLMQYLSQNGYRVFALSFAQGTDDNYYWAEQIYDALQVIKSRTGASHVDIISWSKGTVASRMYVSNVRKSWGTAYAGDVRRLVLAGGLNGGWDWLFRHGTWPDLWVYPECGGTAVGGTPHTTMACYGFYYQHPELSVYRTAASDYFIGLRQMLARWDGVYALPTYEYDWYTTYYGGWGSLSYSHGITYAINQGTVIPAMRSAGTPQAIPVYLLCGGANDIPNWHNEHTGPSDGTVFTASCSDTAGIGTLGASVTKSSLNHFKLVWDNTAMSQMESWLR